MADTADGALGLNLDRKLKCWYGEVLNCWTDRWGPERRLLCCSVIQEERLRIHGPVLDITCRLLREMKTVENMSRGKWSEEREVVLLRREGDSVLTEGRRLNRAQKSCSEWG